MDFEDIGGVWIELVKEMELGQVQPPRVQKLVIMIQLTSKAIFTNVGLYIF